MRPLFLLAFAVVLLGCLQRVAPAQKEWVRAGTFVDWPDTLTARELPFKPTPSQRATPVRLETVEFAEQAALPVPESARMSTLAQAPPCDDCEIWQILPDGLLFPSYLAGEKEPRFASQWLWEKDRGRIWEAAIGGRWGLFRHGTPGTRGGEGIQLDVEGAGLVRIDPEADQDLEGVDFRVGSVLTWRRGRWRAKGGYYHISSHVGDEFLIDNPGFPRRNYVRDAFLIALMYDVTADLQVYGEFAGAWNANGGAEPGELQFGAQYAPAQGTGFQGAPFAAINGHLRQEFSYAGSVNVVAGWAWRGAQSNHLLRAGLQYYSGPSLQYSFFDEYESLTGLGIWFDY